MVVEKGSRVIHQGMEKVVEDIAGDVIILNDKSVVRACEITVIAGERTVPHINPVTGGACCAGQNVATPEQRHTLRSAIEGINTNTAFFAVMAVVGEIDPEMRILPNCMDDVDRFKRVLIHRALALRKIDPKVCRECGQVIGE